MQRMHINMSKHEETRKKRKKLAGERERRKKRHVENPARSVHIPTIRCVLLNAKYVHCNDICAMYDENW